jgi:hypothetical protein
MEPKWQMILDEAFLETLQMLQNNGFDFIVFEYPNNTFRDFAILGFSSIEVVSLWRNAFDVNSVRVETDSDSESLRCQLLEILKRDFGDYAVEFRIGMAVFGFFKQSHLTIATVDGTKSVIHTSIRKLVDLFLNNKTPSNRPPLLFHGCDDLRTDETLVVDLSLPITLRRKLHNWGIRTLTELAACKNGLSSLTTAERRLIEELTDK